MHSATLTPQREAIQEDAPCFNRTETNQYDVKISNVIIPPTNIASVESAFKSPQKV